VLGAGGVGGFLAALLAEARHDVTVLLRPATHAVFPDRLLLESPFGRFTPLVEKATELTADVDVLWITVKATQLDAAIASVPDVRRAGAVVPLLNGIDHIAMLRARCGAERLVPATIGIESERVAPGHFVHRSPFATLRWSAIGESRLAAAATALTAFGCRCEVNTDEVTMLWRKLVMLGPLALTTTSADVPLGDVMSNGAWRATLEAAVAEACEVAAASGAQVDVAETLRLLRGMPPTMRSSMQKDVAAGTPPELDAIAGPILRGAARHGLGVPVTAELARSVEARAGASPKVPQGPADRS